MTLADLRKIAIRKQTRIRFALSNGMECVLNEFGVAQVPALASAPGFNLETELAGIQEFRLDALTGDPKAPVKSRTLRRDELGALADSSPVADVHDHDDE